MSSGSTGSSMAFATGNRIPKTCGCGAGIVCALSKSSTNQFRRYFRCAYAHSSMLSGDKHVFKWIDDLLVTEVDALTKAVKRLEEQVSTMSAFMEDQERLARIKAEAEVSDIVEEAMQSANRKMVGSLVAVGVGFGVLICIVGVGLIKLFG